MKKTILTTIILNLVLVISFSGCGSNKKISYPKWYKKIYNDTHTIMYATAKGSSIKDATTIALNDIASRISTTISSKYSSSVSMSNNSYNKTTKRDIINSVKKIDFTSYQTMYKKKISNNNYIVLIKVNKQLLASSLEFKIKNNLQKYTIKVNTKYDNIISKLKKYKSLEISIKQLESSVYILQILDELLDAKQYLKSINTNLLQISDFRDKLKFTIKSNIKNKFSDELISIITQKGYSIVKNGGNILLNIDIKKKQIVAFNNKIIKITINIILKDKLHNKTIGKESIVVSSKSMSSFAQANDFAVQKFHDKLIDNNILETLLGL
jgi:hypothetical protein